MSEANAGADFVHYFNTPSILEQDDIEPWYIHPPPNVGHVKLASHSMRYIELVFGWTLEQTRPEVQHETSYWCGIGFFENVLPMHLTNCQRRKIKHFIDCRWGEP